MRVRPCETQSQKPFQCLQNQTLPIAHPFRQLSCSPTSYTPQCTDRMTKTAVCAASAIILLALCVRTTAATTKGTTTPQAATLNICDDSCAHANNGICEDGGPGSTAVPNENRLCSYGTDCADCGARGECDHSILGHGGEGRTLFVCFLIRRHISTTHPSCP
jgi:hypothetical protein